MISIFSPGRFTGVAAWLTIPLSTPKGTVKWKILPLPSSLSAQIRPPMSSTSLLLIESPRPVPPYLRVVDASTWVKLLNRVLIFSRGMPIPVSLIVK